LAAYQAWKKLPARYAAPAIEAASRVREPTNSTERMWGTLLIRPYIEFLQGTFLVVVVWARPDRLVVVFCGRPDVVILGGEAFAGSAENEQRGEVASADDGGGEEGEAAHELDRADVGDVVDQTVHGVLQVLFVVDRRPVELSGRL